MIDDHSLIQLSQELNIRPVVTESDIAALNLICAQGLPGAEELEIEKVLSRIDEIAAEVGRTIFLRENYEQFLHSPARFHNSQAYFCMVCMASILQTRCGVKYNPRWQHLTPVSDLPADFCLDARDQHIHAILDGTGGTCGSLPVFYVAIGRRLGFR